MELVIAFLEGIFSVSALKQRLHCVLTPMNEEQRTSLQLRVGPLCCPLVPSKAIYLSLIICYFIIMYYLDMTLFLITLLST